MDELKDITEVVLVTLREKLSGVIPQSAFNIWFGDFNLVTFGEKAIFTVPTPLRKRVLDQHLSTIREALFEVTTIDLEVEIVCDLENTVVTERGSTYSSVTYPNAPVKEEPLPEPDRYDQEDREKKEKEIKELIESKQGSGINGPLDKYTFSTFVEGSSNKFALAACKAVVESPNFYNPLFIWGQSGLGKTHLLYAIINGIKKQHPKLNIVYKKCEDFMNELISAISQTDTAQFKDKYRNADVLLIDDIQFIAGKEATQEEFFHTFTTLYENNKQIILTSDKPPKAIKPLEDRLRTRFEGGLIADIQPPNFELRTAIIKSKADSMNLLISTDLVDYMAERLNNNVRQIEGVLKNLYALYSFSASPVTKEAIDKSISHIDPGNIPREALVENIMVAVSRQFGVSVSDIISKKKTDIIANARHIAIYLVRNLTDLSLNDIGAAFGDRDHTTVLASINKAKTNIKTKKGYEQLIYKIERDAKNRMV